MIGTQQEFKHLFTPGKILNVDIKNRFVFLPHWSGVSSNGMPTEYTADYYVERAKGGAGLVILESMAAHPKGRMGPGYISSFDRKIIPPMKDIARRIHEYDAKVFSQLQHCGSTVIIKGPQILYGPSAIQEPGKPYVAKEIEKDEIEEVVRYFGISAAIQRESEIDGIELKIGHDGLLRAFASPYSNRREDEYGGCFENRIRFLREIIQEIRKRVGNDYPLGARVSFDEFTPWGYSLDYGLKLAKALEEAGVDYISTDVGTQGTIYMQVPPMVIPLGYAIYVSAELKKIAKVPVIAFGRINDPVQAETILAEGNADFIGMCRQLICDPETPLKTSEGRLDDIRHCVACMDGCMFQTLQQNHAQCIQNPAAGHEAEFGIGTLERSENPKNIMVIGGGVAGMKVAEVAARRGHKVDLYEKSSMLGGQVNLAEKLPNRLEIGEVTRYLKMQLKRYNVAVHLNTEVDIEKVEKENPDIVVVATGSHSFMPEMPGEKETDITIMDAQQALLKPEKIGQRVVVFDGMGHWRAAGIVEYAQALGAEVHYFTSFNQMGVDLELGTCEMLYQRVYENGIDLNILYNLYAVTKNSVVFQHSYSSEKKEITDVDTLIIADRGVANDKLYKELKKIKTEVYSVGDCAAPRLIQQAIFDGEELGRKL